MSVSLEGNVPQFREQREKFKKEALRIRKLNNPHIIKVHDFFEENGTAYYVMDYIDGLNLGERLKETGRAMSETEVRLILPQILDALKAIHDAGIWHLDLKPANIMLAKEGVIKLIDFGASKQFNAQKGGATTSTGISYTSGYAPREQMEQNYDKFGPWTDFYALGATLYTLLTNKRPPLPTDIDDDISEDKHLALPIPSDVRNTNLHKMILWMMSTNRNHRPQSVEEIREKFKELSFDQSFSDSVNDNNETVADEETILATSDNDYTIYDNSGEKEENTPQIKKKFVKESTTSDNNNSPVITILLIILAGIILLLFIINAKESRNSYSNSYEEPKDTVIEFDSLAARVVVVDYVTNSDYDSPLGKCKYTGATEDGIPSDEEGEAKFEDGRYYKGPIVNGVFTGENAFFKYQNGDTFKGTFKNNSFYEGTYTIALDGSYFTGTFKNGQPDKGTWYDKNGNIIE